MNKQRGTGVMRTVMILDLTSVMHNEYINNIVNDENNKI